MLPVEHTDGKRGGRGADSYPTARKPGPLKIILYSLLVPQGDDPPPPSSKPAGRKKSFERIWAHFQRILELFAQKIVTKLSKIWVSE